MKEEYSENYRRWYDKDPVISKTVELLRVVPQQILNDTFEKKFENIEFNLEKKVIERLKSQSIASRIKKFFLKN